MSMLPAWDIKRRAVTIANGTAIYAANDNIGGLVTFTDLAKNSQNEISKGYVASLHLQEVGSQAAAVDVYLFENAPTAVTDNGVYSISSADLLKAFACISVASADYKTLTLAGGGTIKWAPKENLVYGFDKGDGSLYAVVIPSGTPTFGAASVLKMTLGVWTR
jgi:hypothetical protein